MNRFFAALGFVTLIACSSSSPSSPGGGGSSGSQVSIANGGGGAAGGSNVTSAAGGPSAAGGASSAAGDPSAAGGAPGGAGGAPATACGDGFVDTGEKCDDGNTDSSDGCSATCRIESGWSCDQGEPTHCTPICGDGLVVGAEAKAGACDDGHTVSGDGCSSNCTIEEGYACSGAPSVCAKTCGNGKLDPGEGCEDGNTASGDGCFACMVEKGFTCMNGQLPSTCGDVNECATAPSPCDPHATCSNTAGSFSCACKPGFTGDGKTCTDVDECQSAMSNCSSHANCSNTTGSFTCACKPGYSGNGVMCEPASCVGLDANCGASLNDDCCASPTVPGGTFWQGNGTIASFALDKYEVTVARFKKFVSAYTGPPAVGAGAHPLIAGSGWQATWNASIAADKTALTAARVCDPLTSYSIFSTWDDQGGANDDLPLNCVTWYEALAFCAWDGGRLPTTAEWQYAAIAGSESRTYPWGNTPVPDNLQDTTASYAVYDCLGDGSAPETCSLADILKVGSKPLGAGKYGQLDLAGSVSEWQMDDPWVARPTPCNNCLTVGVASDPHSISGSSWIWNSTTLPSSYIPGGATNSRVSDLGFRCARTP